jgi:hypothetical protein
MMMDNFERNGVMLRQIIVMVLAILFFLTGCSSQSRLPSTSVPNTAENTKSIIDEKEPNTKVPIATEVPQINSPTVVASQTPIPLLATSKPTSSLNVTMEEIDKNDTIPLCLGKEFQKAGKDFSVPGTIVVQLENKIGLFRIEGIPSKLTKLPIPDQQPLHIFGISPDGKWLAYSPIFRSLNLETLSENPKIILLGSDGKRIEHSLDFQWLRKIEASGYQLKEFAGGFWLNNTTIYAMVNSIMPDDHPQIGHFYPVIFDPFDGNWLFDETKFLPILDGFNGFAISPDLKNIIYDNDGISIIEKKNSTTEKLWSDKNAIYSGNFFGQWSPDSSRVVFASQSIKTNNGNEVYLFSKDDKKLMKFQNSEIGNFYKSVYWSTDSKYFAFLTSEGSDKYNLFVFDALHYEFVIECPLAAKNSPQPELIWSPDNSWIAISQKNMPIRVLNINDQQGVELNVTGKAIGWSDFFR